MEDKKFELWRVKVQLLLEKQYLFDTIKPEHKAIWLQAYNFILTKDKKWLENNKPTFEMLVEST